MDEVTRDAKLDWEERGLAWVLVWMTDYCSSAVLFLTSTSHLQLHIIQM